VDDVSHDDAEVWAGIFLYGDLVMVMIARTCGCQSVVPCGGYLPRTKLPHRTYRNDKP
jgi:hypothetical protein